MTLSRRQIKEDTDRLKRSWSFLGPLGLPLNNLKDRSAVFERELDDGSSRTHAFVKIYSNRKSPLQRLLRASRSRNEARNLLLFQAVGIETPRIIAWGTLRNRIGRIVQEFIATEAVPQTRQLDHFIAESCPDIENPEHAENRMTIARHLGRWTRAMHDSGFIHEDLKWRNILAREAQDKVELFWIDCPNGHFMRPGYDFERKKLKDCATLDKIARFNCSKEERRTFIKNYLGSSSSEEAIRILCQNIEDYRRQRFDPKDNRQRQDAQKN